MKKILLCIDMQNDFINGTLSVDGAEKMVYNFEKFAEKTKLQEYDTIIVTQDWHPYNHCSFLHCTNDNGKEGTFNRHCIMYSGGAALDDNVIKALFYDNINDNVVILHKGTNSSKEEFSIFGNESSGKILASLLLDVNQIDICGIADIFCVKETIKDLIIWD